jgi:tetratricopeptide (TPR) repeat protein
VTLGPLFVAAALSAATAQRAAESGTFEKDVAPIIESRCLACHRPGGDAPFSLATADDVRRRATMIAAVTKSRYMPPWKPVPGFGDFRGSRRMTAAEISIIERWVQGGMPAGTGADARRAAPPRPDWESGTPDLILQLPTYTVPPDGPDLFRNFVVAVPPGAKGFVRGMQFRPGSRAVHHANVRLDATPASRRLDEADPDAGYEGVIARSADFPDGQFLGWTPGQLAPALSEDTSWQLRGGTDLVLQLHLRPTGKPEEIAPVLGLYLGERAPAAVPTMLRLGRQDVDIPPGASAHRVTDSFVVPVRVHIHAIQPHAHYRARSIDAWATLPDGSRRPLLRIDDWDMNWQDRYVYTTPVELPAGTRLSMTYVFDNSTNNPRNPDRPPVRARWGWRSSDEMADVWIQAIAGSDDDRAQLARAISLKMMAEDTIGSEVLLEREPDHINLRNDAAQLYLALGQPARALAHFERVRSLQPVASAAFNTATALEAMGRATDAESRYQEALRLDANYSPAHNTLGALWLRAGRIADSSAAFERAIAADANNADARANLGLAKIAGARPDQGLLHLRRAVEQKPELLGGLMPHAWLLAAHHDRHVRRPLDALALAKQIDSVSANRADALDLLAAAYAATGDFDAAVQSAGAALSAAPVNRSELRTAIAQRLALYRSRSAYTLPK